MNKNFSIKKNYSISILSILAYVTIDILMMIWNSCLKVSGYKKMQMLVYDKYPTAGSLIKYLNEVLSSKKLNSEQKRSLKFNIKELQEISKIKNEKEQDGQYLAFIDAYIRDSKVSWALVLVLISRSPLYTIYKYIKNGTMDESEVDKYVEKALKSYKIRIQ